MKKEQTTKALLVSLDSLLDTRLGCLYQTHEKLGDTVAANESYYTRHYDDWHSLSQGQISQEEFTALYQSRDIETLKISRLTKNGDFLRQITKYLDQQRLLMPDVKRLEVVVNTYPYELTSSQTALIEKMIGHYCHPSVFINSVSLPVEDLTPKTIKNNWDGFIFYDFDEWFRSHEPYIEKTPIPRNQFFIPSLLRMPLEQAQQEYHQDFSVEDFCRITALSFVQYVELNFLDVSYFTIKRHTDGSF